MTPTRLVTHAVALVVVLAMSGCMVSKRQAPVVERAAEPRTAVKPARADSDTHVVKRGETLYSIAATYGLDHRTLARLNRIDDPSGLRVGQVLQLQRPAPGVDAPAAAVAQQQPSGAVATPFRSAPVPVEQRPGATSTAPRALESPPAPAADAGVLTTPKAVRQPYSDAVVASLRQSPQPVPEVTAPGRQVTLAEDADQVPWAWPVRGKIIAQFNENSGPKGLHIAGELGQPVLASAAGRVVYSGSGLRGYGNLVIIKHNDTFLSAYAHNRQILVKEGQTVAQGERIAEMGNSDANRVMLHFEIRRLGKPVDPIRYLPPS